LAPASEASTKLAPVRSATIRLVDRESKKPKVIVMRPMAMRRTRPSITDAAEVVACLLEPIVGCEIPSGSPARSRGMS
jgi:hypothetical protein